MKITIFSNNQARHLSLAKELSQIADEIFFICEINTIFPGQVDDFFKKSNLMKSYFINVIESQTKIFGDIDFLPINVKTLAIKFGDLSNLNKHQLTKALNSDFYIIFGSSFIKGWLADFLVANNAINIHIGLSPYYRGSSCNFWALYDNNPGYVGATIHFLSKGLDSGPILFHCLPNLVAGDSTFDFTMRSVLVAHKCLVKSIYNKKLFKFSCSNQDKSKEIRYSKKSDFTDDIVDEFLNRKYSLDKNSINYPNLINPQFG